MMKAVFISDAHLKLAADERYVQLIHFLADLREGKIKSLVDAGETGSEQTAIDDLYILGDFFDFWFCRKDHIHPEFRPVISCLVELQKSGVRIHLCEGNHDFFMEEYFNDVLGMEVFEEWADIKLDHLRVLVGHGDTADHGDRTYRMFRKILRSRIFYHIQRFVPASIRWGLAGLTSNASKQLNDDNSDYLVERMLSLAMKKFNSGYDAVILGHCHKPVLRHFDGEGKKKTFVTLGDWIKHYSFLYYENGKFFMCYYPPR
ncbi:MAG: UDP-2,3-diacylglucosamine diphosphatase [Deltaproteobacteria bacterium]|nr:UDP-2,3-diacylglucosamine diphosphatase [Deltaproteobacteria bacterium]